MQEEKNSLPESLKTRYQSILPKIQIRSSELVYKEFTDFLSIGLIRYTLFDKTIQYLGSLGMIVAVFPQRWVGQEPDLLFIKTMEKLEITLKRKGFYQYAFDMSYILTFFYKNLRLHKHEVECIEKAKRVYPKISNEMDYQNRVGILKLLKGCKLILTPPEYTPNSNRPADFIKVGKELEEIQKRMEGMARAFTDGLDLNDLE